VANGGPLIFSRTYSGLTRKGGTFLKTELNKRKIPTYQQNNSYSSVDRFEMLFRQHGIYGISGQTLLQRLSQ